MKKKWRFPFGSSQNLQGQREDTLLAGLFASMELQGCSNSELPLMPGWAFSDTVAFAPSVISETHRCGQVFVHFSPGKYVRKI